VYLLVSVVVSGTLVRAPQLEPRALYIFLAIGAGLVVLCLIIMIILQVVLRGASILDS
jgi:hypothetical protein